MIEKHNNGLYIVELADEDLMRVQDILDALRNNGLFNTRSLIRTVTEGKLNTIIEFGTDRNKEQTFEDACKSVVALGWNNNIDLCFRCKEDNTLDDVSVVYRIIGTHEMHIRCPYREERGFRYAPPKSSLFCPFYMSVEAGPRIIYARESYHNPIDNITDEDILADEIETMNKPGKTGYCHKNILVYEHSKLKPFDIERYIFCDGVNPKDALKAVLTSERV
jgi:hypothetical protein